MKKNLFLPFIAILLAACFVVLVLRDRGTRRIMGELAVKIERQNHLFDIVNKKAEDAQWFNLVGGAAYIDKVRITGPPHHNPKKNGHEFHDLHLDNDVVFYAYVFIPRWIDPEGKYPLIVFPHGGIHGTFSTVYSHVIKELMAQGYIVVAPDYRGSIGYGQAFCERIDYGGRENEDALASRDYMVRNYSMIDASRVGLLGWSHGGMISLMNILKYPDKYACAFAGVPVSDLEFRIAYKDPSYSGLFSAGYHIGQTVAENPEEYRRRSPSAYASLLERPLMITTTENDDDVSVHEVQRMADSLAHYGKEFEYKVYGPMSGAHLFDRIDTGEATDIRFTVYRFLEKHLSPPSPFRDEKQMREAGYGFN